MDLRSEQISGESYFQLDDAIFALATVPGKSAVAVFRCSGTRVWKFFEGSFSRYHALVRAVSHSATYGFLLQPEDREKVDEVLLLKFCAPSSYSGEDMLEIHCHGSIAVLDAVRRLLQRLGLREAERGEFTYRSIKYGKRNLHQAEAIALLAESQSQNQRRSALEQLSSTLLPKLQQFRGELLQVLARSELQLDYDETELEFHYELPDSLPLAQSCLQYLGDCLASYRLQKNFWKEYKVVLVGATNSGKSSLFNRLLTRDRSIVSERAGTTRDYLESRLELGGQTILLYDSAGLRSFSDDPIEKQGIQRTWELLEQADFLLLLSDVRIAWPQCQQKVSMPSSEEHEITDYAAAHSELEQLRKQLLQLATERRLNLIEIWNKCDLLDSKQIFHLQATMSSLQRTHNGQSGYRLLLCSAHSGRGLAQLVTELETSLKRYKGPQQEAPVSERQARLLQEAADLLAEYCDGLRSQIHECPELFDLDWASELLRQICGRLGEVSGEACNATILREIFQQFCVGK